MTTDPVESFEVEGHADLGSFCQCGHGRHVAVVYNHGRHLANIGRQPAFEVSDAGDRPSAPERNGTCYICGGPTKQPDSDLCSGSCQAKWLMERAQKVQGVQVNGPEVAKGRQSPLPATRSRAVAEAAWRTHIEGRPIPTEHREAVFAYQSAIVAAIETGYNIGKDDVQGEIKSALSFMVRR